MTFTIAQVAIFLQALSVILMAASLAYQIAQTFKKSKSRSMAASSARKGFELVLEGNGSFLPKVYGRAKVGGTRVFHNTTNNYKYQNVVINADQVLQTSRKGGTAGSYNIVVKDANGVLSNVTKDYSAADSGLLTKDRKGSKHEFLWFQQAICKGRINKVVDVIIDNSRYLNDPSLSDRVYRNDSLYIQQDLPVVSSTWHNATGALRLNIFQAGGVSDNLVTANFPERATATFDGMAYASAIIRLDKESPQFGGVPDLQFIVEGSLVRRIIKTGNSYTFNANTYEYSNNPSWCLLDYLLDSDCGKGVDIEEIDLASFENAAKICDTIVQLDAPVGGKIYRPTNKSPSEYILTRNIPLYECNILIDPSRTIRENIEAILETMGDARLVWSGGKYKLSLNYPFTSASSPKNNAQLLSNSAYIYDSYNAPATMLSNATVPNILAGIITEDDLIESQDISVSWPSASQRLNYCTVRFHNEFEDFREDSVSWPPKFNGSYNKGIGGISQPLATSSFDDNTAAGSLLNEYGVWAEKQLVANSTELVYQFSFPKNLYSTACKITIAAGSAGNIVISKLDGTVVKSFGTSGVVTLQSRTVELGSPTADVIYKVVVTGSAAATNKSIAAKIESGNFIVWTTRSVAYASFLTVNTNNSVYTSMLSEDSDLKLEFDLFTDGLTDPYHALAKAEELVRTSRSAFSVTFKYTVKDNFFEPGDIIQLQSEMVFTNSTPDSLNYSPVYLKIESVKINEDSSCEVTANRFDYTQLAWGLKTDAYILPRDVYDTTVPQPEYLTYVPQAQGALDSSGTLSWPSVTGVDGYIIYAHTSYDIDSVDSFGMPVFKEIGRSMQIKNAKQDENVLNSYQIQKIDAASAYFGVRATLNGRLSNMTYTDTAYPILLENISYSFTGLDFKYNQTSYSNTAAFPNRVSWPPFSVLLNSLTTKSILVGGYADWTEGTLYIYYDPINNQVKSTTSPNVAENGKLLLTYTGNTNGVLKVSTLLPPTDLYVLGTAGGIYTGRDLEITWKYPTNNYTVPDILSRYLVQIWTKAGVLKRSFEVSPSTDSGGYFRLSYDQNVAYFGTATRAYNIRVYSVDISGALSPSHRLLEVDNPVPALPQLFEVTSGFNSVSIKITPPTNTSDIYEYIVYQSDAPLGVSTYVTNNIAYTGKENYINIPALPGVNKVYSVCIADTFGRTDCLVTSGTSAMASSTEAGIYSYSGLEFSTNAAQNKVIWTAGKATKYGDSTAKNVSAGEFVWSSGLVYIYYLPTDTGTTVSLHTGAVLSSILNVDGRILATYKGGSDLSWNNNKPFVDGDQLLAGSVGAAQLTTGVLIANKGQIGDILESDTYAWQGAAIGTAANYAGWRLYKDGTAQFSNIEIRRGDGTLVFNADGFAQDAFTQSLVKGVVQNSNMLYNGGFEYGTDGWAVSAPLFDVVNDHNGKWLKLTFTDPATENATIYSGDISVLEGETYTATCDTRLLGNIDSGRIALQFRWVDPVYGPTGYVQTGISGVHDFEDTGKNRILQTASLVIPVGITAINVIISLTAIRGEGSVIAGIRQIKLEKGTLATRYASNLYKINTVSDNTSEALVYYQNSAIIPPNLNVVPDEYASFFSILGLPIVASYDGYVTIDTVNHYVGTASLKLSAPAAMGCIAWLGKSDTDHNIQLIPNMEWVGSYYLFSTVTIPVNTVIMTLKTSSGATFSDYLSIEIPANTWTRVTADFDLLADNSSSAIIRVAIRKDNSFPAKDISFDGILLQPKIGQAYTPNSFTTNSPSYDAYNTKDATSLSNADLELTSENELMTYDGVRLTRGVNRKVVNAIAANKFTTATAHGYVVGDTLAYDTSGTVITGLTKTSNIYTDPYVVSAVPTTTTFYLSERTSVLESLASIPSANRLAVAGTHTYTAGMAVVYTASGTAISGLTKDTMYYVSAINLTATTLSLSTTVGGTVISIAVATLPTGTHSLRPVVSVAYVAGVHYLSKIGWGAGADLMVGKTLNATAISNSLITFATAHNYQTNDRVTFTGTLAGLISGNQYYVIKIDALSINLSNFYNGSVNAFTGTFVSGQTYTVTPYTGDGAYLTFKAVQNTGQLAVGLANANRIIKDYTTIDYAILLLENSVQIYENGTHMGTYGQFYADDQFAITYDAVDNISYYRNGIRFYETTIPQTTDPLVFKSSFYNVGASISLPGFSSFAGLYAKPDKIDGLINSGNVDGLIADNTLTSAKIGSIALVGKSSFNVKTSSDVNASRIEMDASCIKIFEANVLRVKLGDLTA